MGTIDTALEDIERSVSTPGGAEQALLRLIADVGEDELRAYEADFRHTISLFYPKRRRDLTAALDRRLQIVETAASVDVVGSAAEAEEIVDLLVAALRDLSDRHIFSWATFYRDSLPTLFEQLHEALRTSAANHAQTLAQVHDAIFAHSSEIFRKGYDHVVRQGRVDQRYALTKSLNGLEQFLNLPLEFYSTRVGATLDTRGRRTLRALSSSLIEGILTGYASVEFGSDRGSETLSRNPHAWAHTIAFLTQPALVSVMDMLPRTDLREAIDSIVRPLIAALDGIMGSVEEYVPLPTLSQFAPESARLEISLLPPPTASHQAIEVQAYLFPAYIQRFALLEASRRDLAVVIAPLRPDLSQFVRDDERLAARIVDPTPAPTTPLGREQLVERIRYALEQAIFRRASARAGNAPLSYNFAREFPLQNPFLTRYFHVHRSSVRDLLRAFERRNGVRLWCSVRRSGKTTACFDLGTTTGESTVVPQTCASTGQHRDGNHFYERVLAALELDAQLDARFFERTVAECGPEGGEPEGRYVFILDEYETLFGRLRIAGRDDAKRYEVVQPLLDQMVAFTRDHLLVFLGQQPNAHFILMDQNQLSAYVEQDPFPLFRFDDSLESEFAELIRRVLGNHATFDLGFARGLFSESSGHPFLTVNLLSDLIDWVIECGRPAASLSFGSEDVEEYVESRLDPRAVARNNEYRFFREAIAEATSRDGRAQAPWLFAVYSALRAVCRASPETMSVSISDFEELVAESGAGELGFGADDVLATGAQANFLLESEGRVMPRIRLLGRVAAVSRARVSP